MVRRSSRVLIVGIALLFVGLGNWGYAKHQQHIYKQRQREAVRMGGPKVTEPFQGTLSILDERTEASEIYEEAVVRYRYYKVFRRGGRFLMMIGGILIASALLRRLAVPFLPSRAAPFDSIE